MQGIKSRVIYDDIDDTERTSINIKKGTSARLKALKSVESWDDFFIRLIDV